jgi:hypothetical protein
MQPEINSIKSDKISRKDILILFAAFVLSRIIVHLFGLEFQFDALYKYWQYLNISTLKDNLLIGVYYDHTQPPVFNLFLGFILKITGDAAPLVFAIFFKLVSLANALLLLSILKKVVNRGFLPIGISLLYLLSPATLVFENELFYTSFVSLLFLVACYNIVKLGNVINWKRTTGILLPLVLICLTRSMYHLLLLVILSAVLIYSCRKRQNIRKLVIGSCFAILLTSSWYVKNYFIFGQFSTSSWIGMNMARNIFHDNEVKDSSKIEAFEPFLPVSTYKAFVDKDLVKQYAGLNDTDLLLELKYDSLRNLKHIDFLKISELYLAASKKHVREHPVSYVKNVMQSMIIFFTPATRYSVTEKQARKIAYYDAVYSANLSVFAEGKQQRRIALTISAIPQMLIYAFVLLMFWRNIRITRRISLLNAFIFLVIAYVFATGSLLEHYENMRFRFELQPLFYLLLAQAIVQWQERKGKGKLNS